MQLSLSKDEFDTIVACLDVMLDMPVNPNDLADVALYEEVRQLYIRLEAMYEPQPYDS